METDKSAPEAIDICTAYQVELQRKADLLCQQKVAISDIQKLSKDVHHLSEVSVLSTWAKLTFSDKKL